MKRLAHVDFEVPGWGEFEAGPSVKRGFVSEVLADGPAGWWRLGETEGATAGDSSGGGLDGVYEGGVELGAPGPLAWSGARAGSFGGSGVVKTGYRPRVGVGRMTLLGWVYLTSHPDWQTVFCQRVGTSAGFQLRVGWGAVGKDRQLSWTWTSGGAFQDYQSGLYVEMNRWHQVGVRMDWSKPDTVDYVLDGRVFARLRTSGAGAVVDDPGVVMTVGRRYDASMGWRGRVAEVAVYEDLLSEERVMAQYSAGVGR